MINYSIVYRFAIYTETNHNKCGALNAYIWLKTLFACKLYRFQYAADRVGTTQIKAKIAIVTLTIKPIDDKPQKPMGYYFKQISI